MTGFKDHFSGHAAAYATHRPTYPAALADWLAEQTPARETALDCGCGNGQLSILLADRFERVVATDASAQQIASAVAHPRVDYRVAPAEASRLPDASVDLITVAQAAHWFDLDTFYAEVLRVARPGAVLALITYVNVITDAPISAVVDRFYGPILDDYWQPERRHVEAGYQDLPFPFEEYDPPKLAIELDWNLAGLIGYIESWSATKAFERAGHGDRIEQFRRDVAAVWGNPNHTRHMHWPLLMRVGRVA
ncbi:class I SAM-dependent methyltransferase [Sphingomonas montanisoli]|uniref:Class I SAM-dependent methyltransferase n=1 Tax=Sphingomonas montanisoli TaxID=2606412 RepID=A0A5D9C0I9_9SPHN|nr:class I SAM-dependent methyltransferase [Sphingomonas montanisoli]TZG25169.1 class I SAM-dependent methyltransferase [Sphingomonas montanisoli]